MGKTRGVHETTPELRNRMVGMYEAGLGLREIAAAVNCSQRTVKRWLNRFDKEGTVETRERCGRKRSTTQEQDEAIIRLATQTPITAAKAVLPALGLNCSVDTVRERLHKAGIHNWSPSRKYMQRIALGESDGTAIQQAVWRPTGTQLGKKKSPRISDKNGKHNSVSKKKNTSQKSKSKDTFVGDGAPTDPSKQPITQQTFVFPQQSISQTQENAMEGSLQPLAPSQPPYSNTLNMPQQPQSLYPHPDMNIAQNWPLDLVQGSEQYPQGQTNPVSHEEPSAQQPELHTQQEQQQHHVQVQQQTHHSLQNQAQQQNVQCHHQNLDQQQAQLQVTHQVQQQHITHSVSSPPSGTNIHPESLNSCSSNDNSQSSSGDAKQSDDSTKDDDLRKPEKVKKKKKGGKAKGTLETSVEIRNRMIGMSEAGLSTLSIALAIDRSERTVKRWLERWHKEGNVQTKERKGRRRSTTKEQDEAIVAMATQHPLTAAKYVAPALGLKCSVDTIRERLHKAGIHSWKLGKKQGEGNAVHTVHLWQPSGNRSNKPKTPSEKKRRASTHKKRDQIANDSEKESTRKKRAESPSPKIVPPPANLIPEPASVAYHNPTTCPSMMQPIHNIPPPPPPLAQPQPPPPVPPPVPPSVPPPIQPIGHRFIQQQIVQQRPDCRLAPAVGPAISSQGSTAVAYPPCMIGNNGHTTHMDQPDPLNYEPYIWSF